MADYGRCGSLDEKADDDDHDEIPAGDVAAEQQHGDRPRSAWSRSAPCISSRPSPSAPKARTPSASSTFTSLMKFLQFWETSCDRLRTLYRERTAGGTRTPNRRFWRPLLYQLSYCRKWFLPKARGGLHHPPRANSARLITSIRRAMISATRPAPTVLPPSRMAKRMVFSMATGVMSSTSIDDVVARHDHLDACREA